VREHYAHRHYNVTERHTDQGKEQDLFPAVTVGKRTQYRGSEELTEWKYPQKKSQNRGPDRNAGANCDDSTGLVEAQRCENGNGDGQSYKVQERGKCNDGEVPPEAFWVHRFNRGSAL